VGTADIGCPRQIEASQTRKKSRVQLDPIAVLIHNHIPGEEWQKGNAAGALSYGKTDESVLL
jgi:hypothetical protein